MTTKQLNNLKSSLRRRENMKTLKGILQILLMGLIFSLSLSIAYLLGTNTFYLIFN
jgi:hypothetical protein